MMFKICFIFYFVRTNFYFQVPRGILVVETPRAAGDENALISIGNPYYAAGSRFGACYDQNASGYVTTKMPLGTIENYFGETFVINILKLFLMMFWVMGKHAESFVELYSLQKPLKIIIFSLISKRNLLIFIDSFVRTCIWQPTRLLRVPSSCGREMTSVHFLISWYLIVYENNAECISHY